MKSKSRAEVLFICWLATLLGLSANAWAQAPAGEPLVKPNQKPNIFIVFADDISARDLPFYGSSKWSGPRASTPVLDQMAKDGAFVSTMWSMPLCKPSRVALLTGRYATVTKWWDNEDVGRDDTGIYSGPESSPRMIAHVAREGGYRTLWAGKTHVVNGSTVQEFGFDEGIFTPGEIEVKTPNPYPVFKNLTDPKHWMQVSFFWWPELMSMNDPSKPGELLSWLETRLSDFGPDLELKYAFDFIDRTLAQQKPFFILYSTHLGHKALDMADPAHPNVYPGTPVVTWNPKTKTYSRSEPSITPSGQPNVVGTTYTKHNITPDHTNANKAHIEYLDYQVWLLTEKLRASGQLDNTVILFLSDNPTVGYGKGSVVRQRGSHVPLLVYAPGLPGLIKGRRDIQADLTDLLPTVAELAGVQLADPDQYPLHGKSLVPVLTGKSDTHRPWIYAYRSDAQMIRNADIMRDGEGQWFDVRNTPEDLDSFSKLDDLPDGPEKARLLPMKIELEAVLKSFDVYNTEHGAPGYRHYDPPVPPRKRKSN